MRNRLLVLTTALAIAAGVPAMAANGVPKELGIMLAQAGPPGLAKKPGGLPPGLAKKPYGLPPGQAKKLWSRGQHIPQTYYTQSQYVIAQPRQYRLASAPPGYRWVLVEDNAYLVQNSNGLIANVVANAIANLVR